MDTLSEKQLYDMRDTLLDLWAALVVIDDPIANCLRAKVDEMITAINRELR